MTALSTDQANSLLSKLQGWKIDSGELVRTFEFQDFSDSLEFVNKVGEVAEAAKHHPDVEIRYSKVRLALVTHDAGGLTEKDFYLAGEANKLA
jgi:4a-hydroxytetrahydrobiopterin dehydratase